MMVEYTMVRLDILVKLDYLVKFDYNFTRYPDPIMVYSFAMCIRVNLGDHMCFCNYGLGIIDINKTSRGHGITLVITVQRHMSHHKLTLIPMYSITRLYKK